MMDFREDGKPKEECGIFGLRSRALEGELAQRTYFGLYALQHRGQEAAGIAVSDGERTLAMRDAGLVSQIFDSQRLESLESGHMALGHVRYSTTGSASWENSQPEFLGRGDNNVVVAHNGNLVNAPELRGLSGRRRLQVQLHLGHGTHSGQCRAGAGVRGGGRGGGPECDAVPQRGVLGLHDHR